MELTDTDNRLLRAMSRVRSESNSRKSVVVLRYALLEAGFWDHEIEDSLCNTGQEHPLVAEYYNSIRRLVRETSFADCAGNFEFPAGPRYTECWITPIGMEYLERQSTYESKDDGHR
jgi:hypothetical protein